MDSGLPKYLRSLIILMKYFLLAANYQSHFRNCGLKSRHLMDQRKKEPITILKNLGSPLKEGWETRAFYSHLLLLHILNRKEL